MIEPLHILFPVILTIILLLVFFVTRHPEAKQKGKAVQWRLDQNRATEIISNKRLGSIQQLAGRGGVLKPHDLVIVWAQEFLDDDILYEPVKRNIQDGIRYLYILDVSYTDRVLTLLRRLIKDIGDRGLINDMLDVIFVKPTLTLNNYVLMSAETGNDVLYSGLIYDERPFGWVLQHQARAAIFLRKVKRLVATISIIQVRQGEAAHDLQKLSSDYGISAQELLMVSPKDQIMDFSIVGQKLLNAKIRDLDSLPVKLGDVVSETTLPEDADNKIVQIAEYVKSRGERQRAGL